MPGLLSEEEALREQVPVAAPEQASVTEPPTNPEPGAEVPSEDDLSPQGTELLDKLVQDVYSEKQLPRLKKLFESGGLEGFPQSMAVAVVGSLGKVNLEGADNATLAEAGVQLFQMLTEDIVSSGVVEGVTPPILMEAVQATLTMAAEKFPDRVNLEEFAAAWQQEVQAEGQMGPEGQAPMPGAAPEQSPQPQAQAQGLLSGGM